MIVCYSFPIKTVPRVPYREEESLERDLLSLYAVHHSLTVCVCHKLLEYTTGQPSVWTVPEICSHTDEVFYTLTLTQTHTRTFLILCIKSMNFLLIIQFLRVRPMRNIQQFCIYKHSREPLKMHFSHKLSINYQFINKLPWYVHKCIFSPIFCAFRVR